MSFTPRSRLSVCLVALALLASAACERSPRRPTVVPAQPPAEKPGVTGEQPKPGETPLPGLDTDESELPAAQPSASPSPSPSPSVSPSPDVPGTDTTINDKPDTPTTTPGADDISKWDGQSFKGNDKFDVQVAP